jgi:hypothetical protein
MHDLIANLENLSKKAPNYSPLFACMVLKINNLHEKQ